MVISASIFLISLSLLAYEIFLMRIFSITSWSHFAYMVISMALLGFGASGSFLFLFRERINKKFDVAFVIFSFLYATGLFICTWVAQLVPFSPFLIVWYKIQYLYLFASYLILFFPFFLGASCIGMSFMYYSKEIPRMYFFNMTGSGAGALMAVLLMYILPPANILFLLCALGLLAACISAVRMGKKYLLVLFVLSLVTGILFYLHPLNLRISEYKGLSKSLNLPRSCILKEYFSPLGLIHVLESPAIRYAPGLSFNFKGKIPPQLALFTDADSMSAINHFEGDISSINYLDYLTSSLPYHLIANPKVLVVGAGGGSEVLNALYHGATKIEAVEVNPQIIKIIDKDFAEFAGKIFSLPQVKPVVAEGRGYMEATDQRYDLIQISLLDSFAASSAGVYALSESYLYTVEAMVKFLEHLNSEGFLCITRWIKIPPRDGIRILSTSVEALERMGIKNPSRHILMIRSWSTSTILVGKSPLSPFKVNRALKFARQRSFDVCWYPGIKPDEVNKFNILPQPYFYQAASQIFSVNRQKFYQNYLFDITPTTDNSPYFFHFFKWKSLPYLLQKLGKEWIPFLEWGYIILIATLIQAGIAGAVLVIFPLFFLASTSSPGRFFSTYPRRVLLYFLCLGIGYMFLEISFIQRFILFLHYPIYTVAVVITGFLIFSGLGSYFSPHFTSWKKQTVVFAGIVSFTFIYLLWLRKLFLQMVGLPDLIKIIISLGLIAPVAFFMGMPFPLGLGRLTRKKSDLVPWAWGINGCASVISSVLATVIAVSWGFTVVGLLAILLYTLACLSYPS